MNPQDPLAQLSPLREPAAIGLWPPAPGWWLLLAAALVALAALTWWLWQRYRANAYRRQALRQAAEIYQQWCEQEETQGFVAALNQLLKATALQAFPADQVAALHGDAWVEFLQRSAPGLEKLPDQYGLAPYSERVAVDPEHLYRQAQRWIRQHRSAS